VEVYRHGDEIVLRERKKGLERAFEILASLPNDIFPDARNDPPPQSRNSI
jgi:antitoxin VapB